MNETATAKSVLALAEALEALCHYQDHVLNPDTRRLFTRCYRALRVICEAYGLADRLVWDPAPGNRFVKKAK